MLTTKSLSAFLAVVREGSITRAAHSLHLTQSAVSQAVNKLEADLGFPLFERNGGKLQLTEEGITFFQPADSALQNLSDLSELAVDLRAGSGRKLRLFTMSSALPDIIPLAMPLVWDGFPKASVSIEIRQGNELNEWGLGRRFDLGIIMVPSGQTEGEISMFVNLAAYRLEVIGTTPAIVVMPKGHRFEKMDKVSLADLTSERLISTRRNANMRRWLDRQFASAGLVLQPALEAATMTSAAQFASRGLGVAIADKFSLSSVSSHEASHRPLREELTFTFAFAIPREHVPSPLVEEFKSAIRKTSHYLFS